MLFRKRSLWATDVGALCILICYGALAYLLQPGASTVTLDETLAAAQARGTLRVATDVGFRPFSDLRAGQVVGYDIDLARAVAAKLGLRAEFVPTGFDGLYDTLTSGRADLIASALPYAPEFGDRARFSQFYFDAGQVLLAPVGAPITGTSDLAGRRVGVALGSDADALARQLATSGTAMEVRSNYEAPEAVLAALQRGEISAAIVDNVAALAATDGDSPLRIVLALSSEPYVLAVAPRAFQLHAAVNQAIDELRAEGFFEELNRKWFA